MADATERNQVLFGIITSLTPEFPVVNFNVGYRSARLACPAISEHPFAKLIA